MKLNELTNVLFLSKYLIMPQSLKNKALSCWFELISYKLKKFLSMSLRDEQRDVPRFRDAQTEA